MSTDTTTTAAQGIACLVLWLACEFVPRAAFAQAPPPGVFFEVQTAMVSRINPALEPATVRSRVVQVDTQKITAARRGREVLKLNLFDDAVVEVQINRVRPTRTGYFISGTPKGRDWGDVRLVVNGPVMVGTVVTPEDKFTIRSGGFGRHVIRQIDSAAEPFECKVVENQLPARPGNAISSIEVPPSSESSPLVQADDMPTEDGSQVRVLVVYTPAMQAAQGGATGMKALIDLMIQSTNQAFEESGITPRVVLAHATPVDYVARGPDMDLTRLENPNDGFMDQVHSLRNKHAADLVHLLTNVSDGLSGKAAQLAFESVAAQGAFAVTADGSEAVFVHEIGHNFGLAHDRYTDNTASVVFPYAFGYVNKRAFETDAPETARWQTVMAYPTRCSNAGFGCQELLRFSNPNQTYRGDPLGVPASSMSKGPDGPADARRTINNTARWVGSYRSEACTDFAVSPETELAPAEGGEFVFAVDTTHGCLWNASSQTEFISVGSEESFAGPGLVNVKVNANDSGDVRSGTLTVAGKTITVRQLATSEGVCGRTAAVLKAITETSGFADLTQCAEVTSENLAGITSLDLRKQGLSVLKEDDFRGLSGLQELLLAENRLNDLPAGIFADLSNLRILNLDSNRLSELPDGLVAGLSALSELHLRSNQLAGLPQGLLDGLSKLGSLNLAHNELANLPQGLMAGLSELGSLDLSYNTLADLPQGLFVGLPSLQLVNLESNHLTNLTQNLFSGLSKLESLNLSYNTLAELPQGVFEGLNSLDRLDLRGNALSELPSGLFAGLTNLRTLKIGNNQLSELSPGLFAGLSSLEFLDLSAIYLSELPAGLMDGLRRLKGLELWGNTIGSLPDGVFSGLSVLTHLDLAGNRLTVLPTGVFSGMTALQDLSLRGNQLTILPHGVFSGLAELQTLDLSDNVVDPLPLPLSLQEAGDNQFKVVAPMGAPFLLDISLSVGSGGSIDGGASAITIPTGAVESTPIAVSRVADTKEAVTADVGTLPKLPGDHKGYALAKDDTFPLRMLPSSVASDAELINLLVSDGTLAPAFDSESVTYKVIVQNTVSSVTMTPIRSNPQAKVEYIGENEDALPDSDASTSGHQVNLNVGENTINIRVTSEDGTASKTFALVVIRESSANVCGRTPQVRNAIMGLAGVGLCTDVAQADLAEITTLNLVGTKTRFLTSSDFDGLSALRRLRLENNELRALPPDIFSELSALEYLNLNDNRLLAPSADVFLGLTALQVLQLGYNRLGKLPTGIFSKLPELRELSLQGNGLNGLPADLFSGLPKLELLRLFENSLRNLPAEVFGVLSELTWLSLRSNELMHLPSEIFSGLHALEYLGLSANQLNNLPVDVFADLSSLRYLYAHFNNLTSLPVGVFSNLSVLETIWLSNNQLSRLPDGIFSGLTALKELDLGQNIIDPLPLPLSLQKVEDNQFKAIVSTGAPFRLEFAISISDSGLIEGDSNTLTIPIGATESTPLKVARADGMEEAVTVDIGAIPGLPDNHVGYRIQKDETLPRVILPGPKAPPPVQVTGVRVTRGAEQLDVFWDALSDADGYKVQWKSGAEDYGEERQAVLSGAETVHYTITGLTGGTEYTIRVIATEDNADDGEPSEEVTATPISADPDVNGDGVLNGDDALAMYHSYASTAQLGDGETGGTPESRQSLLAGYSGKTSPTDDDLKAMIRKANVWKAAGVDAGGDINEDGAIDESDAFVMYYAYTTANLVGDGETGGTARFRQLLLSAFANKENPTDEDLKAMLRRANKLREEFA